MKNQYYKLKKETGVLRKYELIKLRGCKCEICGYNKNIAALDFHHLNPNIKDSTLNARGLQNLKVDKIKSEFDKCIVICSNCHRELHNPELNLENIKKLSENSDKNVFTKPEYKRKCPKCEKPFKTTEGHYWKHILYCCEDCVNLAKTDDWPSYEEYKNALNNAKSLRGAGKLLNESHSTVKKHVEFYESHIIHPEKSILNLDK